MSLEARLKALVVAIGADVKSLNKVIIRKTASDPMPPGAAPNSIVVTLDGERGDGGVVEHFWSGGALPTVIGDVTLNTATNIVGSEGSLRIANTASAANAQFALLEGTRQAVVRFYIRTPATWPSAACTFAGLRTTTTSMSASITMTGSGSPGRLRLTTVGGTTVAETPGNTLALNTNYRVEVRYDADQSMAVLNVYLMGEDNPLYSSGWIVNSNFNASLIRVDLGRINATPAVSEFFIDGVEILSGITKLIGRHETDVLSASATPLLPYVGPLGFWDGTKLWPLINHI